MKIEKFRVPEELFIDELQELYPTDDLKAFHKDKVYAVCDCIIRGMSRLDADNFHPQKDEPYFVPLSTKVLKKLLGGNCYIGILEWMVTAGIIIPDGSWQTGVVAQGYRFTDYFLDLDYTWKTVTCETLLKKDFSDCFDNKYHFQPAVVKKLKKWFDGKKLKINSKDAYKIIDARKDADIVAAKRNVEKLRQARIRAMLDKMKIENFEKGDFHLSQDGFGYRVHTALTQLPKEFRSLVTYDGKPMVEVDLSCSQLFFSCFLLNYRHWRTAKFKTYKEFTKELWNNVSILSNSNSSVYSNTIMCISSLEMSHGQGLQRHEFLKKCCEGLLYESVVDRLDENNFPAGWDYQRKRKHVKKLLLDQLFANPANPEHKGLYCAANKPILDAFTALYPEVMHVYLQIKQCYFKDLCRLLQRTESIAMIGFVCKRLQKEYPQIPLFTLHDCLITTADNEDIIMKVMQEEITKYVGFTPKMKPKRWSQDAPEYLVTAKAA